MKIVIISKDTHNYIHSLVFKPTNFRAGLWTEYCNNVIISKHGKWLTAVDEANYILFDVICFFRQYFSLTHCVGIRYFRTNLSAFDDKSRKHWIKHALNFDHVHIGEERNKFRFCKHTNAKKIKELIFAFQFQSNGSRRSSYCHCENIVKPHKVATMNGKKINQ